MYFWFKKKEIVIDAFCTDNFAMEYCKIDHAIKYYPEWWKALQDISIDFYRTQNPLPLNTMKNCRGFTQLYKNSIIIPFWGSAQFIIHPLSHTGEIPNPAFDFTSKIQGFNKQVGQHTRRQFDGFAEGFSHIKLEPPWVLKCNKLIEFVWHDPVWNKPYINSFTVLPAVIDFKYQMGVNINLMVAHRKTTSIFNLLPNQPIVCLTAMTNEKITIKHHLVTHDEMEKHSPGFRTPDNRFITYNTNDDIAELKHKPATNTYKFKKDFLQKHEERNKPKCPFGFGSK